MGDFYFIAYRISSYSFRGNSSRAETIRVNTVFELPWRIPDDLLFPWYRGIDERHGEMWRMDSKAEKYFFRQNLRLWYCCYSCEILRPFFGPFFWHLQFFMKYFIKSSSFHNTYLFNIFHTKNQFLNVEDELKFRLNYENL